MGRLTCESCAASLSPARPPLCVALAASMVGAAAAIACALGRILRPAAAWLGRILPRRGDWGNDWEMDGSSAGMYFVTNVELRYNKKNTR